MRGGADEDVSEVDGGVMMSDSITANFSSKTTF